MRDDRADEESIIRHWDDKGKGEKNKKKSKLMLTNGGQIPVLGRSPAFLKLK